MSDAGQQRFTALDAVGPYEVLGRLPGARAVFVTDETGPVTTDVGTLALSATATLAEVTHPALVAGGPEVMVIRSLGLPMELDEAVTATGAALGGSQPGYRLTRRLRTLVRGLRRADRPIGASDTHSPSSPPAKVGGAQVGGAGSAGSR